MLPAAVVLLVRSVATALLLAVVWPVAAGLRVVGADWVVDAEFPRLMPYVSDGWHMKHEFSESPPRASIGSTLRLLLRNSSDSPTTVSRVLLNGIPLNSHIIPAFHEVEGVRAASYFLTSLTTTSANIRARLDILGDPVWFSAHPPVVEPGGYTEVSVRLRSIPRARSLRLSAGGNSDPVPVGADIRVTTKPVLRVAFASFSDAGDRLYLHLRRTDGRDFEVAEVRLDGKTADLASNSSLRRSFCGVLPLELTLEPPWRFGSFHHVRVRPRLGADADAVVRVRDAFFALGMWGYRNNGATDEARMDDTLSAFAANLFNTAMGMHFLDSPDSLGFVTRHGLRVHAREPNRATRGNPAVFARFLLDEPDAHDASVANLPPSRRLGALAQGIVTRRDQWFLADPRSLSLLNVNLTYKPENWWTYGQIADILALDPYYQERLVDAYWRHPGYLASVTTPFYVYACAEIARWAASPRPTHVILNCVSRVEEGRRFRFGTPEEKRIEFFHALAAGAKGISYWWFTPYGECKGCGSGEPEADALLAELRLLNGMARSLEPLLSHAWPAIGPGSVSDPITTCAPSWLMPRTLFAGTHAAVIVLVNRDHASDASGTLWQPIPRARVFVRVPPWLSAPQATLVTPEESRPLDPTSVTADLINYEIQDFPLAALLILRAGLSK
jgi:hypothetical protein